ncbi:MAG: hypothetical protein ACOCP4_05065 [Candidatus Woesearchaeota archaeon]
MTMEDQKDYQNQYIQDKPYLKSEKVIDVHNEMIEMNKITK